MYVVTFDYTSRGCVLMKSFVCKDMQHVLEQINHTMKSDSGYTLTGIFKKI